MLTENRSIEEAPPSTRAGALTLGRWWNEHVLAGIDHRAVQRHVHDEGGWSSHYAFMTLVSAGIAILGLLLSSPAVVIGAMLISPLMGPIIGLGFALATFDSAEIRRSLAAIGAGILLAVGLCAVIVALSPLQTVTEEIAARTRPNLFDLLVALFSGLGGTYAMIRGRHGAIVGVAIAVAVMPPLAAVGFGLATRNWSVLAGSSLLFFTNLMTIAGAAAALARLYGFGASLSPRQTRLQAAAILLSLAALAVPLGLALRQIAWESLASRQISSEITGLFGQRAQLSSLRIEFDAEPIAVQATVFTPEYRPQAETVAARRLDALLRRPVELSLEQVRTGGGEEESADIAAVRGSGSARVASRVAQRLALVAGVEPSEVLVDQAARRALVRAQPLSGADLGVYRALEARVAASEPGWTVTLVPPLAPLPTVSLGVDGPDAAGADAIETAIWGVQRLRVPVGVAGPRADDVVDLLRARGVEAVETGRTGERGETTLAWSPVR